MVLTEATFLHDQFPAHGFPTTAPAISQLGCRNTISSSETSGNSFPLTPAPGVSTPLQIPLPLCKYALL